MILLTPKIMVTLDGSAFADQALPHAEQLASALGAELILFRVVPDTDAFLPNPRGYPTVLHKERINESTSIRDQSGQDENPLDTVDRALENLAEGLRRHDLNVSYVVDAGSPPKKIIDYLQHNGVDLLVMSTHGRSGVARAVFRQCGSGGLPEGKLPDSVGQSSRLVLRLESSH